MPDSLQRALHYHAAKKACAYARSIIIKGATQTINNTYSSEQRISLEKGINDLRKASLIQYLYDLEKDFSIRLFHKTVELCKKLSLGSCFEYSLLALDYLLINSPILRAEIFTLDGGDHTFLVIGRNPASLTENPKTWGKNAFICDPWMNKVYPAYKYVHQLRNYFRTPHPNNRQDDFLNHTEKFDSAKHTPKLIYTLTTSYLRIADSLLHKEEIIGSFKKKAGAILEIIKSVITNLQNVAVTITNNKGELDSKRILVEQLISTFTQQMEQITTSINQEIDYETHYVKLRSNLQNCLRAHIEQYIKATTLLENNKKIIFSDQYAASPKSLWMHFFKKDQAIGNQSEYVSEKLETLLGSIG